MRMIGRFAKRGTLRYISHLDILRTMARAMSRAEIPVRFSQGFHPHAQFSFAQAAQTGMVSEYEIIDIKLEQPMESGDFLRKMQSALPPSLPMLEAVTISDAAPSSMAVCAAGSYAISLREGDGIEAAIAAFEAAPECIVMKKTKSGEKPLDIRPLVHALALQDEAIHACLDLREGRAVRPAMLVEALSGLAGREYAIAVLRRTELYALQDDHHVTLMEFYRGLES